MDSPGTEREEELLPVVKRDVEGIAEAFAQSVLATIAGKWAITDLLCIGLTATPRGDLYASRSGIRITNFAILVPSRRFAPD